MNSIDGADCWELVLKNIIKECIEIFQYLHLIIQNNGGNEKEIKGGKDIEGNKNVKKRKGSK